LKRNHVFHEMCKETESFKIELPVKGLLLWVCLTILSCAAHPCQADNTAKTRSLIEKATITYQIDFSVDSPLNVWNKVLDHPVLMGKLWNLYNFQPAYQVTKVKEGVEIIDTTGIKGKLSVSDSAANSRTFYGRGEIDHWAVPSFISAEGVFQFRYQEDGQHIKGKFELYLRGDNEITDLLMKLFSGTLKIYLSSRFTNNMRDMKRIIFDLLHNTDHIRKRLTGDSLHDFMEFLSVSEKSDKSLEKGIITRTK